MAMPSQNSIKVSEKIDTPLGSAQIYSLKKAQAIHEIDLEKLPFSFRILSENLLRNLDRGHVTLDDIQSLVLRKIGKEIPYMPTRVLLQDFTGVPLIVDLAAMRDKVGGLGLNPSIVNPHVQTDLVIDHSLQVDFFGSGKAFKLNIEREYARNSERYSLLRWAQTSFKNMRVVPPGTGIVHQVNLEYLGQIITASRTNEILELYPDTLVGTDSHTTMINSLSTLGWGVGGIEAESVMLGQPYYIQVPRILGVKLVGKLPIGSTGTDLVLTVTQTLRTKGVVNQFVEFFGPGLNSLTLPDRATISNMSPEYGSTIGFFPIDSVTLDYMRSTGRDEAQIKMIEDYAKLQSLFYDPNQPEPLYTEVIEIDLATIEPSLAGPTNPEDRVALTEIKESFKNLLTDHTKKRAEKGNNRPDQWNEEGGSPGALKLGKSLSEPSSEYDLADGSVIIAAITSCTNTSNPSLMVGAGLLAKKAIEKGLQRKWHVKTSLAPGSRVVTDYLSNAGLLPYLEEMGFHLVGYGCTTCIGNSGPLDQEIKQAVVDQDLYAVAVLSGNRNFEARIHPNARANFLGSPILVVAYAIAGTMNWNPMEEPIGKDPQGKEVYLHEIWPSEEEIQDCLSKSLSRNLFRSRYSEVFQGDEKWKKLPTPTGELYQWNMDSTYIRPPPFFEEFSAEPSQPTDIINGRVLVMLGDKTTTDHISPAGSIAENSPAAKYLTSKNVEITSFNTYGSRRGNHEIMMRGTFANTRLRNELLAGQEGGLTVHGPTKTVGSIYDIAARYKKEGTPLIVLAGKAYGSGSSRDWAAKGTQLLGVKAVLAENYERIHRSNLIGMSVLPLQFLNGDSWKKLGLDGTELYTIEGLSSMKPRKAITVKVKSQNGDVRQFDTTAKLETEIEVRLFQTGGLMNSVLRDMIRDSSGKA
ncbi:MAG: aconitate hydratase AcnA [Nitrososphaerales archaeon]